MAQSTVPASKPIASGIQSANVISNLISGLVLGITQVIITISLGNLVFSGTMAPYSSLGISLALFSAGVVVLSIGLLSGINGVVSNLQDSTTVFLAATVASLVGGMTTSSPQTQLATVLVMIVLSSVLMGATFLLLGVFKLGKLVRFIPYPVVGGFLAGTGGLLVMGGLGVMGNTSVNLQNLPHFVQSYQPILWVPGIIFAMALFFALRRVRHFLTMPAMMIGTIAIFYVVLLLTGVSTTQAQGLGFLAAPKNFTWQPFNPALLGQADWQAILGQLPRIVAILMIGTVHLLLNVSSLELAWSTDVDLNRELKVAGIANFIAALGGGMIGYHSLSLSSLSRRVGAKGKLAPIISGAVCFAMLIVGAALISYFPRFLLGGLLVFLGFEFLNNWLIQGRLKMPMIDYAVMILIMVVVIASGFLIGVGVGLVLTIVLFIVNYSRINVVRHALSGAERTSNVVRPAYHQEILSQLGDHIYILELQGYVFFGTANSLLEQIKAHMTNAESKYVVLDFRRVTGLDASAILSFSRIKQMVESKASRLILCHMTDELRKQLAFGGLTTDSAAVKIFADLDRGLEWCEDQILSTEHLAKIIVPTMLSLQLRQTQFDKDLIHHFVRYLEKRDLGQNEYLVHQGDPSDDLFFIETGRVSVYQETANGERFHLRTLDTGTMVGELGLLLGTPRTASVITDGTVVAYRLTLEALGQMKTEKPDVANAFHEYLTRILASRLVGTDRLVEALSN